ncbi:MAG: Re/Si-specific NAD(P)(+) transhydrogenase subunit alpha [Bacteroidota bacterium]
MTVGVPVDTDPHERRVPLVPSVVPLLTKIGTSVLMQKGAGDDAGFPKSSYEELGVRFTDDRTALFSESDILVRMHGFRDGDSDLPLVHSGQVVLGLLNPYNTPQAIKTLAEREVTSFALEFVPRIARSQSMDALTSMASLAGYKGVLIAAHELNKIFPMTITAAGAINAAKVFVVGAGVAGLQAIATARRLGAVVQAYDVRPIAKEQVESLGGKFVELTLETKGAETAGGYAKDLGEDFYRRQREMMLQVVAESDAVITTAAIPGKKSPVLVTKEMVERMRPGSVIVDLAAEGGGNCELTKPGENIVFNGIKIVGPINLPSTIAFHASQMYSRNIAAFLQNLIKEGRITIDLEDQIIRESLLTHQGVIVNPQMRTVLGLPALTPPAAVSNKPTGTP